MKNRRFGKLFFVLALPLLWTALLTAALWFWQPLVFYAVLPLTLAVCGYCIWHIIHLKHHVRGLLDAVGHHLNQSERDSLIAFPMPIPPLFSPMLPQSGARRKRINRRTGA